MQTATTAQRISQNANTAEKQLIVIEAVKKEIIRVLLLFLLVSVVFLFLRILLELLGADPQTLFAGFIYLVSDLFLFPFFGIFPQFRETIHPGQPTADIRAFIAIICYIILDLLAVAVVTIGATIFKTGKQVDAKVEKDTYVDPHEIDKGVR